jgi:hypothetical protein
MNHSFDASIPVLTEILYVPDDAEVEVEAQPLADDHAASPQASGDQAWSRLEQQLSTRILSQLQQQMPIVLEQRINEMLQGLGQTICADLQANVQRIVEQELGQMKAQMKTEMKKP